MQLLWFKLDFFYAFDIYIKLVVDLMELNYGFSNRGDCMFEALCSGVLKELRGFLDMDRKIKWLALRYGDCRAQKLLDGLNNMKYWSSDKERTLRAQQ